jgi:cytochrome c55X
MLAPMEPTDLVSRCRPDWRCTVLVRMALTIMLTDPAAAAFGQAEPMLPESRQRELIHMVRQDCGACHGMTLKGGLGPPLTPQALQDKPVESLVATILNGRPGTPMPPWGRLLSAADGEWIAQALLRGLPAD